MSKNKKIGIVTGGNGFLGPLHAQALLDLGMEVIVTDVQQELDIEQYSNLLGLYKKKIHYSLMDVTDEKSVVSLRDFLISKSFNIAVLINNAAVDFKIENTESTSASGRIEDFSCEQWDFEVNVGLKGAFITSKIFGSQMNLQDAGGIILNIASDLSVIAPNHNLYVNDKHNLQSQPKKPITYSAIKHGLLGITKYISTYWPEKVRCNAISPGGIFNNQDELFRKRIEKLIPMKRMCEKHEIVGAVKFLCSENSSYVTGQNIVIDGGRSVW